VSDLFGDVSEGLDDELKL